MSSERSGEAGGDQFDAELELISPGRDLRFSGQHLVQEQAWLQSSKSEGIRKTREYGPN